MATGTIPKPSLAVTEITNSVTFNENITGTNTRIYVKDNVLFVFYQGESKTHSQNDVLFQLPSAYKPQAQTYSVFVINNTGYGNVSLNGSGSCFINQIANGGTAGRIYSNFSVPLI